MSPMGYDNDIRRWLYRCQQIAVQHPLIRETIAQYINLIKELTHQMENNEHKKELLEVMAQNADATAAIYGVSQVEYIAYLLENRVFPVLKFGRRRAGLGVRIHGQSAVCCKRGRLLLLQTGVAQGRDRILYRNKRLERFLLRDLQLRRNDQIRYSGEKEIGVHDPRSDGTTGPTDGPASTGIKIGTVP